MVTTREYVTFHAAERPDAIAVVRNGRSIRYAEFARHIRKFTHALRVLGLPARSTAAIECADPYFSWLLRLAFEELRVITATLGREDMADALSRAGSFDIVLSGTNAPAGAVRHHAITTAWLGAVLERGAEDHEPAPERRPEDPVRIVRTSGTTGRPKRLLHTRHITETHIARVMWLGGLTRRSRYLLAWPVAISAPAACVRAGGTVVIEEGMSIAEAVAAHDITHTTMPPLGIKHVLDGLPQDFAKPDDLTIWSFGAPISRTLRERTLARLATDLIDIYASNEADTVSSIRGTQEIGTIWPGVRVEVVDADDRPLPFGQAGQIRVRTECMADGYLDFPEAAGRIFKDGWFYSGDVGILHDARRLQVLGRGDEVLNIGWRKIAPEVIEELVLKLGEVADVGVCAIPNRDGIEELCIAVVGQRCSDKVLLQRINEAFRGFQFGRFNVVNVPAVPRTADGKPQRKALKAAIAARV